MLKLQAVEVKVRQLARAISAVRNFAILLKNYQRIVDISLNPFASRFYCPKKKLFLKTASRKLFLKLESVWQLREVK